MAEKGQRIRMRMGSALPAAEFRQVIRHLHLCCAKWDTQVGDGAVICDQPFILPADEWEWLCDVAQQLARETLLLEQAFLENRDGSPDLGISKALLQMIRSGKRSKMDELSTLRTMRFDFHPTAKGWRVSEVNSDFPGGWTEASALPQVYGGFYPELELPPDPLGTWTAMMLPHAEGGCVALLCAAGYLEDLQVVFAFMRKLRSANVRCVLIQTPEALIWEHNSCWLKGSGERVAFVVRFYQIEWLCSLPRRTGWRQLLQARIPVTNPAVAAISESKRFPLLFQEGRGLAWNELMPECRDPREVASGEWDKWVLKAAYSNTGDKVYICGMLGRRERDELIRSAMREPHKWIAQRRFETTGIEACSGLLYPCVGVFVVEGKAAGAYIRLSRTQVTDGAAQEAPLLIQGK